MKVRIKFSKTGVIKFIGHLDLMRFFQKAFRRTDIKVRYSGGFSPHMIMSFAQALGVGVESKGEYFDVELEDGQDIFDLVEELNRQMVEGIEVISYKVLPEKTTNAMASVAAASYEIDFYNGNPFSEKTIDTYNAAPELLYTKTTKSGDNTLNIKDFVFAIGYMDKGVSFTIDASSAGNIKPRYLLETLAGIEGIDLSKHPYHVMRMDLLLRKEDGTLAPLDDIDEQDSSSQA